MRRILFILVAVWLETSVFGMSNNGASGNGYYREIFQRFENGVYMNGQPVYNNWNNPAEALRSSGMLGTNYAPTPMVSQQMETGCPPTPMVSPRLGMIDAQPRQQVLPADPEWYRYINWDPEEPSSSHPMEISQPAPEADKIVFKKVPKCNPPAKSRLPNRFLSIRAAPQQQSNRAYAQPFPDSHWPARKNQLADERSRTRLKKVRKYGISFTRRIYQEITRVSSTTASRDFTYGLDHGILVESRVLGERLYTFVKKI